jgi:predicted dithiol-disulfide oxidoreductase (DUF899 family)
VAALIRSSIERFRLPQRSWLDRAPMGRNETGLWWHRHDEYGKS